MRRELRNPLTSEPEYTDDELEFILAQEKYRRENRRRFLTSREILRVAESLGYRKVAAPQPLPVFYRGGGPPA